jgi:hypothetical protein
MRLPLCLNYKEIHSTNFVGGFRDYFEYKQNKNREMELRHVNSPFLVCDQQFPDYSNQGNNSSKEFECGEKQVKIEENGSFTIETKPAYG